MYFDDYHYLNSNFGEKAFKNFNDLNILNSNNSNKNKVILDNIDIGEFDSSRIILHDFNMNYSNFKIFTNNVLNIKISVGQYYIEEDEENNNRKLHLNSIKFDVI